MSDFTDFTSSLFGGIFIELIAVSVQSTGIIICKGKYISWTMDYRNNKYHGKNSMSKMELSGTYSKDDIQTLDQKDYELETIPTDRPSER